MKKVDDIKKIIYLCIIIFFMVSCSSGEMRDSISKSSIEKRNIQLAVQYLQYQQPLKAIARLKKNIEQNANSAESFGLLAVIYQQQVEYDLAEKYFKKALSIDPHSSSIRNNYGTLLYIEGKYQEAIKQFQAVAKDTYYERRDLVFENIGETYLKMNNSAKAVDFYLHALDLNPMLHGINMKVASIYLSTQEYKKAYQYYSRYLESNKQSPESLWLGIRIAKQLQMKDKLICWSEQLQENYPSSKAYQDYLQWVQKPS